MKSLSRMITSGDNMMIFYAIHPGFAHTMRQHSDVLRDVMLMQDQQKDYILQTIEIKTVRESALSFFDAPIYEEQGKLIMDAEGVEACSIDIQDGIVQMDCLKNPFLELLKRIYPCYIMEVVK